MIKVDKFRVEIYNLNMDYLVIGICAVVIIVLFSLYRFVIKKNSKKVEHITKKTAAQGNIVCPVCGMHLAKGENLISRVYRPMNVPDQYMTVSGCPHCYPVCESGIKRICPVCKKRMSQKDFLTARLFNKTDGSKHVHIAGCSNCHQAKFD